MTTFDLNSFPLVVLFAALLIIGSTILVVEALGRRQNRVAHKAQREARDEP